MVVQDLITADHAGSEDELDGNRWICAFDSGDSSLALVRSGVNGNKVRVIDVHTGTQRSEYSSGESNSKRVGAGGSGAGAGKITAVAWGADGSKENKRQSVAAAAGSGSGGSASKTPQVVALGLHSGSVLLYSPAWNAVVKELAGGHECPVADIVFASEGTSRNNGSSSSSSSSSNNKGSAGSSALFSLGTDGTVVHWDLQAGTQLSRLRTGVSGAGRLLVAAAAAPGASSSRRIVVASHRIEMWDLGSESQIQAWPGHTTPIHTLLWAADETALVSAAQNDRHVQVWDATAPASTAEPASAAASSSAASASRAAAVLAADSEVVYVDVSAAGSVLAVGQNGRLYAWHQVAVPQRASKTGGSKPNSGRSALGYPPDGMLKIVSSSAAADGADSSVLGIHVARFSRVTGDDDGTNVLVVRGSALKPLFETLSLAASDVSHLQFDPDLVIVRDPQDNLLIGSASALKTDAERQAAAQMHGYDEAGANVTSLVNEGVRESQRAMERGASDDAALKGASAAPAPTLADRIQQLSVGSASGTGHADGSKTKIQNLSAGTLIRVLVQSLHTADSALLETVLMNSARPTVVRDTVLGLPTAYVLPFLQQLFVRFQTNGGGGGSSPARAQQLLPWIRHTLALHSAYLTSIPSLVPQLAGFYQSLESRLESHQKLLRLSGRLELANMQIRARSHYEKERAKQERDAQKQTSMEPLNVYREDEEEEEEEEEEDDDDDERSTVPPTPVWQAEESTDSEALSDDGEDDEDDDASAMDEDAQWSDSDAEASSQNGGSGSSSSSSDDDDSDDDDDSGADGAASDSSGDKIML
ncbi:Small subunit (SSU) processome component [Coemansia sp. RSA 1939]|nr:Small subunit (SSU) processome component [Coemansia sp. RSA 1939]